MKYSPTLDFNSVWAPGVSYRIERMSFGRRLDLTKQVRSLLARHEFHAGGESPADRVEASALSMEIDCLYWDWGLLRVDGIDIGDEAATKESLLTRGPEGLVHEILSTIKAECGLTEEERKN